LWKRRPGEWFAPRDFLEKALPNILSQRFVKLPDGTYRLQLLGENRVWLDVLTYPDHLSIVLRSSRPAGVEVRDFRQFVEVQFGDYLVVPQSIASPPNEALISSITFVPNEAYGAFRLEKGVDFERFNHYRLTSPSRVIVDVYGKARVAEAPGSIAPPSTPPAPPADDLPPDTPRRRVEREQELVVIDAGHGGGDYGVNVQLELLEKSLTLKLAALLQDSLEAKGIASRVTRNRDVGLATTQRSAIANFYKAAVFVSLHFGAAPTPEARGPVVYFLEAESGATSSEADSPLDRLVPWHQGQRGFVGGSRRLAGLLQTALNEVFEARNRIVAARLSVLAPVTTNAVLIEAGQLTNEKDRELLADDLFLEETARRIASVIAQYVESQ
jgi:N-acetylmuramoyl-L-alanine amidase